MEMQFSIPDLLKAMGIFYMPGLSEKLHNLLNAKSELQYNVALYEVTKEIFYGDTYFPELPKFLPLTIRKTGDINDDLLLESAIVEVSNTKNIVTTAIQGRDGTVKEFISNGDFSVSIKGIFAYKGLDWPRDNILLFKQYMELGQSLEVTHDVLNSLGIYEVVITDWSLNETSFVNAKPFVISALSDEAVELKILQG
jgi:hypothetical protein